MTEVLHMIDFDVRARIGFPEWVIAAERTGVRAIASVDSDFDVYRLPGKERIRNVFFG